jgi:DNA (cytosine-5)-methyltransferase 1
MTCVAQVEIDKAAQAVLRRHFPNAQLHSDITTVSGGDLGPAVDVLCGGFPCQDVSVAGRRAGLAGARSGLWHEFHRILGEARPRWVVIENVPGLLSSNRGRDFATILRGLGDIGYCVAWRVLDSQYFGVPQRRLREPQKVGFCADRMWSGWSTDE